MYRGLLARAAIITACAPGVALAGPVEALPPPTLPAVTQVAPGIGHQRIVQADGGVVHVVRAAASPRIALLPVLAGGSPVQRGSLTGAVGARLDQGAVAGINGDFFNVNTNDPSGVVLLGGELVHEPEASRSALVLAPAGLDAVTLLLQARYQAIDPVGLTPLPLRTVNGLNRPAKRGTETILYTPAYGSLTTPVSGSRFEVRIRLDADGPLAPNQPRTGTVVASGAGGGTTIGAGHWVLTGVGSAGPTLVSDLPLGRQVTISPGLLNLPPGTVDAIGGGPVLVRGGQAVTDAGEGFTSAQLTARTTRSAIGRAADGSTLFVTVEGPSQGRRGMTVAEQARLMQSLGAVSAIAMDAGGSAQLALRGDPVVAWPAPRSLSDVMLLTYRGVTLEPLPFRLSPNTDRVDDTATAIVRAPMAGATTLTVAHRSGRPTRRLWSGRLGPGGVPVKVDPKALRLKDGVYVVVARHLSDDGTGETEERRRVIVDRTLGSLNARPVTKKVRRQTVRRLDVTFRLTRRARVTVKVASASGDPIVTLASGRPLKPGTQTLRWNRRVRGDLVSGAVRVSVEARGSLGITGLVRELTLAAPPKPRPRPGTPASP